MVGVAEAHALGTVHRDLEPSNLSGALADRSCEHVRHAPSLVALGVSVAGLGASTALFFDREQQTRRAAKF